MTKHVAENQLLRLLVEQFSLDDHALLLLQQLESAIWDAIADHVDPGALREVVWGVPSAWLRAEPRRPVPTSVTRISRTLKKARAAAIEPRLIGAFCDESLRAGLLLWDAFERGYDQGLSSAQHGSDLETTQEFTHSAPHGDDAPNLRLV